MANKSTLEYWSGSSWVEESNLIRFTFNDTVQSPCTLDATIGNFSDTALNSRETNYGRFTKVRLKEGETEKYIFYGKVIVTKPDRDSYYGHTVTITALDNLRELSTNDIDANITGYTKRSVLIKYLLDTYTWSGNIGTSDTSKFQASYLTESAGTLNLSLKGSRKKLMDVIRELAREDITSADAEFGYDFYLDTEFNGNSPIPDFNYFIRGSIPASLPSGGLTLEYSPSTGQTTQIMPIAGDYSFPRKNSEIITRCKVRFKEKLADDTSRPRKLDMILINHGAPSGTFTRNNLITWSGSGSAKIHYIGNRYLIIGPDSVDPIDDEAANNNWLNTISGQTITSTSPSASATVNSVTANPPGSIREAIEAEIDVTNQSYEIETELEAATHAASVLYISGDAVKRGSVSTYQYPRYRIGSGAWVPIRAGLAVYVKGIPSSAGISNQSMAVSSISYDEGPGIRTCRMELLLLDGRGAAPVFNIDALNKVTRDAAATANADDQAGIMPRGIQGWTTSVVFTPDGTNPHNTVDWGNSEIYFFDGTTYAISAGTTGAVSGTAFIYWSKSSATILQTTTNPQTAQGTNNLVLATVTSVASGGTVLIETATGIPQKNYYSLDALFDGAQYGRIQAGNLLSGWLNLAAGDMAGNLPLSKTSETGDRKHVDGNQRDGGGRAFAGLTSSGFLTREHLLNEVGLSFRTSSLSSYVGITANGIIGIGAGTDQFQIQATNGTAGFGGKVSGVYTCVLDDGGIKLSATNTANFLRWQTPSISTDAFIYRLASTSGYPAGTVIFSARANSVFEDEIVVSAGSLSGGASATRLGNTSRYWRSWLKSITMGGASNTTKYINFDTSEASSSGWGLRSYNGTMQLKNNGGSWLAPATGTFDNYSSWTLRTNSGSGSQEPIESSTITQFLGGTGMNVTNSGHVLTFTNTSTAGSWTLRTNSGSGNDEPIEDGTITQFLGGTGLNVTNSGHVLTFTNTSPAGSWTLRTDSGSGNDEPIEDGTITQFLGGSGINVTNSGHVVTVAATGGGGGGSGTVNSGSSGYLAYYPSTGTTVDDQSALQLVSGVVKFHASDDHNNQRLVQLWAGTNSLASVSFYSYANTGMYMYSAGNVALTSSGTTRLICLGSTTHIYNNLNVHGSLTKSSGSFSIPHPLDEENKHLVHGFVESPRFDLIYRGTVTLSNGTATASIDEASNNMTVGTFTALTKNPQVWVQNDTGWGAVKGVVENGNILITAEDTTSSDIISWLIVAERNDSYINSSKEPWTDENGVFVPEWNNSDLSLWQDEPPEPPESRPEGEDGLEWEGA